MHIGDVVFTRTCRPKLIPVGNISRLSWEDCKIARPPKIQDVLAPLFISSRTQIRKWTSTWMPSPTCRLGV